MIVAKHFICREYINKSQDLMKTVLMHTSMTRNNFLPHFGLVIDEGYIQYKKVLIV